MSEANDTRDKPKRSKTKRLLLTGLAALVVAAVGVCAWMLYDEITVAVEAERNLHATLFTIRLVKQYVTEHKQWPASWEELEGLTAAPYPGIDWPAASAEIQQRVWIDFAVEPLEIAKQDPLHFAAIKPIGPSFPYRGYADVPSLQATLRRTVK